MKVENPYEKITKTSVAGVRNILRAASRSSTIKRVVITSSATAIVDNEYLAGNPNKVFTNTDPPPPKPDISPDEQNPLIAYQAAKQLGLAYINDVRDSKPSFSIVTLLPGFIIGPNLLAKTQADYQTGSNSLFISPLKGAQSQSPFLSSTVHIADVAKLHVAALSSDIKDGNYLLSSNSPQGTDWDEALDFARSIYPGAVAEGKFSLSGSQPTIPALIDSTDTERTFGILLRPWKEQVRDLLDHYLSLPE
jgi:nucleoside-diphosphate-sugar epimerase